MSQKKTGVFLLYLNLLVSTVVNIFLTPLLINHLGDVDYSIYKIMHSFAGPLVIFNLGISTIVTRNVVKCRTNSDYSEKEKKNALAMAMLTSATISVVVFVVGVVMCMLIPSIYGEAYVSDDIVKAQKIFIVFVISTILHLLTDAFSGCIAGHEKYALKSSITLGKNVMKALLIFVLLKIGCGVIFVASVDMAISIIVFIISMSYSFCGLKEVPKLTHFDKKQVKEMLSFSIAILLQAIINQVNNNVDVIILGAYVIEKEVITMYSSALVIYNTYNSMLTVVSGFFLPDATKLVANNASGKELTNLVVAPGRFNAIIGTGIVFGFIVLGQDFIRLWIGEKYIDAYYVVLMLIIPVTIPLVENVAISILDASLKRIYRSLVLLFMAIINVIISIILISYIGFWGAALGTTISLVIGHVLFMNIYYAKVFKMEVLRMFKDIFKGILPSGILACAISAVLIFVGGGSVIMFIVRCIVFVVLYALFLWLFGINEKEKHMVNNMLSKLFRKA